MKDKGRNDFSFLSYLTSEDSFKITFFLLIAVAIFGRLELPRELTVLSALCFPFTISFFHYTFLLILLYNTMIVCRTFDTKFDFVFIRYLSKKKKKFIIIKNIVYMTLFCFLIFLIIYLGLIIFTYTSGKSLINPYLVNGSFGLVYLLLKWLIIALLLQIINALLYMIIREKIIIITLLYFIPLYLELFSNFVKYNFFPWIHQTSMIWNYLTDDLISFGLCLILLGFIIIGVEKVVERLL